MKIYVVRHGETALNAKGVMQGRLNEPLNENGRALAALTGKRIAEMGEEGRRFFTDPFHFTGFPNGESISDVCERTQAFLRELIARDDGKTYLVSTHGCALRGMINALSAAPADYWLGHAPYNCSFTVVEAQGGRAKITALDKVFYDPALIVDHYKETN